MRVGLFVPCYIDQFYPQVAWATVDVLRAYGCDVSFPQSQTCCGQPMANTGCYREAEPLAHHFLAQFSGFDYVVSPSGSCVSMVRNHYDSYFPGGSPFHGWKGRVLELCEFLVDVLKVERLEHAFPYAVGLHSSCHGLRELRLDPCSERMGDQVSKVRSLLERVPGIRLMEVSRPDECCGFGGTFAVQEEAVSVRMGQDRVDDHLQSRVEVMTATDMSCLMHLEGVARRRGNPLRFMHVAEILAGRDPADGNPEGRKR